MRVSDFHFDLPEELIAQHPPAERGASRMLVMERQGAGISEQSSGSSDPAGDASPDLSGWALRDAWFRELPQLLRAGDLLVLNDSRVIPARLFARRVSHPSEARMGHPQIGQEPTGLIEVLLTERVGDSTFPPKQSLDGARNTWQALVKPGRKVRVGERLEFFNTAQMDDSSSPTSQSRDVGHPVLTAEVIAVGERGERTLRFAPAGVSDADFDSVIARIGHMPLPPYIRHGQDEAEDRERYQTVYARDAGSAAAPTAGLHFTPEILDALRARGVEIAYVTLHVGLGTFQPVRVERVEDVRLHAEHYTLSTETVDALKRALREGRRVIAVGTTTTRTLEHIAQRVCKEELSPHISKLRCGAPDADWIEKIVPHSGKTSIFIAPGHQFRIVSGLLTNFHLPESTLLMLVSAFAEDCSTGGGAGEAAGVETGEEKSVDSNSNSDSGRRAVLAAYAHAVRERCRFYSYGDCMILL